VSLHLEPTRAAGLDRLEQFVSRAGRHYAARRNFDLGPDQHDAVSLLSHYIRHRLISEEEVVRRVLERHAPDQAEKFIQEVFWRTY
jgi:deoxyribodipyrimidine photo-lyase